MGRPRQASVEVATPERLLEAATEEFAEAGFSGARLEDIARRAGIRRSSLLYHFGSKEALYAAAVQRVFALLSEALFAALSREGSLPERLQATAERFERFLEEHPALAHLVLREMLDRRGPGQQLLLTEIVPLLDRLEAFVENERGDEVPGDVPVRAAMVQLAANILLRAAAGPLREPLWGPDDAHGTLLRALFQKE